MKAYIISCFVILSSCTVRTTSDNLVLAYKPFTEAILKIDVVEDFTDSVFVDMNTTTNIPRDNSESDLLACWKKGRYYLALTVDRAHSVFLNINDSSYNFIAIPGDTNHITLRPCENRICIGFEGKYQSINEYYRQKKESLHYTDCRLPLNALLTSKSTYEALKKSVDTIINKEIKFLRSYPNASSLPDWFLNYEKSEIEYLGAGFKTQMPYYNTLFKIFNDSLHNDYFDFLQQIRIDNPAAILSSKYIWFLDDYFTRDLDNGTIDSLPSSKRLVSINRHILRKSDHVLSPEVKQVYYKYLLSGVIQYVRDSTSIDSIATAFEVADYKELMKIRGLKSGNKLSGLTLSNGDLIPDFYSTDAKDSLRSLRSFSGSVVYLNFWATWCGPCIQNFPALNDLISDYSGKKDVVFINICVDSKKETWKTVIKKKELGGVNLFAEGQWNDKLKSYFSIKGIPHYVLIDRQNILFENNTDKSPYVKSKIDKLVSANQRN